jgi:GAF domain-containing protein
MNEDLAGRFSGWPEPTGRYPRSYLGVPVISRDQVVGVMGLRNYDREYAYTEGDVQLLQTIAAQAAAAIRNAQLYHQSVRQRSELDALHRISLAASASLELNDVLHLICREVVSVMPFHKVAIFLVDDESSTMRMLESIGLSEQFRAQASGVDIRSAQRAEVIRTGQPTIVEDIETDPRFEEFRPAANAENFRAVLDVPLRIGERVIGSLAAYYEAPRSFHPSEIELMQTLGGQVAVAVENARLFEATRARTRELETLYDASTAIISSLSLKNVLRAVGLSIVQALHTRSCVMLIALGDGRELQPARLLAEAEGSGR